MSDELIRRAREADLTQWLRQNGEIMCKAGQYQYIKGFDSLRIQGNKWYRNSRSVGGKSIDFLMYHYGYTFKEAVEMLTSEKFEKKTLPIKERELNENFRIESLNRAENANQVIAYLVQTRGIHYEIVKSALNHKTLFQESKTGHAVFCSIDENENIVGAEIVGTHSHIRCKRIATGSNCRYGYSLGQKKNPRYILFFESAIDLLSFISISQVQKKTLSNCLLVSMAGLKPSVVRNMLQICKNATSVLCTDNDSAGFSFISQIRMQYPKSIIKQPDVCFNDWNEMLQTKHA